MSSQPQVPNLTSQQQPPGSQPPPATAPPTGTRNKHHRNNQNNRNRNQNHPSTSANPNRSLQHQQQQPRNPNQPTQPNHQNRPQHRHHPPRQAHQHPLNLHDRQAPPHLNPTNHPASNPPPNPSNQPGAQKPNRNQQRKHFGSKLTDQGVSSQDPETSTPTNPVDLSSLSLSARLIVELSSSTYDCSICISPVGPYHPIYHCPNCYAIFHLKCFTKWASCSVADTSSKAILLRDRDRIPCSEEALKGEWRCPGCQDRQIGQDSIPKKYTCWCGKLENPTSRNNNHHQAARPRSKIPHGCGQRCGKVSAKGCVHTCMEECHPGSCPPCPAVIKTNCYCQKTELSIRCSQLYNNSTHLEPVNPELLSCGQVCNHELSCGLHSCKRPCHPEECEECPVVRQKSCYCRAVVLSDQRCSDQVVQHPLSLQSVPEKFNCVSKDESAWLGEFSCNDPCTWKYDCGIHSCESTCHPHLVSTPPPCPFSPELVTTCPCGATSLTNRQACSDPISTCRNPCGKLIASCGHACPNICHLGPCGPCKSLVTTVCNCGRDKIVRQCIELEQLKESAVLENELKIPSERKDIETVTLSAIEYRCERPFCWLVVPIAVPVNVTPLVNVNRAIENV
ncbi:hypothetical protein PtB15_9B257 [Puccinia triticina]|nr:hypothetical protein PtB15_9B257 [Puccinia triticina]